MDILLLLVPLSVVLVFLAAWAFRWSLDHDQFEDLERHGRSILDDDPDPRPPAAGGESNGEKDQPG
jgi:cbb3-type cytochrome oxidase maturation protein